ncbi:sulfotransferase family 2 domain-containing protein [Rhizobium sp. G21]|uniref:sulfotransferase family 2 domain-containing protein n=1 Tax=Rhizobium sp. G21 TaxID=2758439 RepID=UPI0016011821|nr:sulfotransferase family 2 domain-containing protein [Rhizobium sp. G21]MBB1248480.1 sulfotransferase family 2 domain-containing protein [Rhizobium sp. G21]
MIVSHAHKLIFLKARKVAGTSLEIALSKYCDGDDIITPVSRADEAIRARHGFQGPCNFNFGWAKLFVKQMNEEPRLGKYWLPLKYYNHIPASLARRRLGAKIWNDYTKLSVVRNPWDRAVSMFFWKSNKKTDNPDISGFTDFLVEKRAYIASNYRNYMIGDRDVVDFYIRYEHFEEDMRRLEAQKPGLTGLWDTMTEIHAKGSTRNRALTTQNIFKAHPKADAMIRDMNAWEIEKFGYSL